MGRAGRKSGCGFFKRHSGLLMSAALVASACQGFCMLGRGVSSGIKYSFKYGFVPGTGGRVTQKARQGEGCQQPPQSRKEDWQRNANDSHNQPEGARGRSEAGVLDTVAEAVTRVWHWMTGGGKASEVETVCEAVTRAWHWMTGGGKASEEEVQKVQSEVEKKGGRIVSNSDEAALINYADCDLDNWEEVVENLALEVDLDDKSKAGLRNARFRGHGEGMRFKDTVERGVRTTTYTAYRTVRDEGRQKIHVIYGRHQLSMEALESGAAFPMGNCIQLGDRTFTVLPPASPHVNVGGTDMKDQWFEVPAGWRVCNASADDWGDVVASVIRPYYWSSYNIVAQQDQQFPAWYTALCGDHAGGQRCDNLPWFMWDPHQRRGRFTSADARVLIEKTPHTSFELLQDWKRFVRLSAQAEWSSRLAPPTPAEES